MNNRMKLKNLGKYASTFMVIILILVSTSLDVFAQQSTLTPQFSPTPDETNGIPSPSDTSTPIPSPTPALPTPTYIDGIYQLTPSPEPETYEPLTQSQSLSQSEWVCEEGYCSNTFELTLGSDDAGPDWLLCEFRTDWNEIYFGECDNSISVISGVRFQNIDIPKDAVVVDAYLQFTTDGTYADPLSVRIYAEESANPETFSIYSPPGYRPTIHDINKDGDDVEVYVPWEITDTWQFYGIARTPDISWLVNRIIEQEGWEPGNSMSFIMKDWGAALAKHRRVFAYERAGPEYATRLYIKYTVPPPYTLSRYWSCIRSGTYDDWSLFAQGCRESQRFNSSFATVVLDFGYPFILTDGSAATWPRRDNIKPLPIEKIQPAVQAYMNGFYYCTRFKPYYQHLNVVVGLTNTADLVYINRLDDARFHGEEWGRLVDRINQWIDLNECIIYGVQLEECEIRNRVAVFSGMDVEPWKLPDGTIVPPEPVIAWLEGYGSVTDLPFINYGTCENCSVAGPIPAVWDQDDILNISWLFPNAFPLPEIYTPPLPGLPTSTKARQWRSLSEYSELQGHGKILFWGSLNTCQKESYGGQCIEGYLDPVEGWSQLFWELYRHEKIGLRPSQFIYSTDITWENYVPFPEFD